MYAAHTCDVSIETGEGIATASMQCRYRTAVSSMPTQLKLENYNYIIAVSPKHPQSCQGRRAGTTPVVNTLTVSGGHVCVLTLIRNIFTEL